MKRRLGVDPGRSSAPPPAHPARLLASAIVQLDPDEVAASASTDPDRLALSIEMVELAEWCKQTATAVHVALAESIQ